MDTQPAVGADKKLLPDFSDQCFLLDFIEDISGWCGTRLSANFNNFGIIHPKNNHSSIFLSKLMRQKHIQEFLDDLPRTVASDLKPNIKLFKVIEGTKQRISVELPLAGGRTSLTEQQLNTDAVSLKSFTFDYLGTQPAEVDYYINCNMLLHFASPDAFFREYKADVKAPDGTSRKVGYSFSDLIARYRTGNKRGDIAGSHLEYDPKKFRIRIDIQYNPDESSLVEKFGGGIKGKNRAKSFSEFLRQSKLSLFLSLQKHTFTPIIKHTTETSFELSIDYIGSVEAQFVSPAANILVIPDDAESSQKTKDFDKIKEELMRTKLSSAQLSEEQQELVANMTLKDIKQSSNFFDSISGVFSPDTGDETGVVEEVQDQLTSVAEKKKRSGGMANSKKQARKVYDYLVSLEKEEKKFYGGTTGAAITESKLTAAYNRPIKELYKRNRIYVLTKTNKDLLMWHKSRSGVLSVNPKEEENLKKQLEDKNISKEEKKKIQERLDKVRESKVAFDSVTKIMQLGFQKGTGQGNRDLKHGKGTKLGSKIKKQTDKVKEIVKKKGEDKKEAQDDYEELITVKDPIQDTGVRPMYFFYFGDLLDVVMDFLVTPEYRKRLDLDIWSDKDKTTREGNVRFILGNVTYTDPKTGRLKEISMAKVPISLELWQQWWLKMVIRKGIDKYLFKAFLRDSITSLIKNAFTTKCALPGSPINQISVSMMHLPSKKSQKLIYGKVSQAPGTTFGRSGAQKIWRNNTWHYAVNPTLPTKQLFRQLGGFVGDGEIVFINAVSNRTSHMQGNKVQDMKNGIAHVSAVGGENKPIKSIEFTKTDQPFFLEAKAERSGILKDDAQFSEPYHANMSIFGHSTWRPGQKIYMYFPGQWFSKKQAMRLGLSGYYLITKVSNIIERTGKRYSWDSKLECKWESWPNETKKPVTYEERMEHFRLNAKGGGSGETEEGGEGEGEGEDGTASAS